MQNYYYRLEGSEAKYSGTWSTLPESLYCSLDHSLEDAEGMGSEVVWGRGMLGHTVTLIATNLN